MRKILTSSATSEWLTPQWVFSLARQIFDGRIVLDPCANEAHPYWSEASQALTKKENGLRSHWFGNVWVNPPYGKEISKWTRTLRDEYESGRVKQALALVPARVDTIWYQDHLSSFPVCYLRGRLKFIVPSEEYWPDKAPSPPPKAKWPREAPYPAGFPSALVYLGDDPVRFAHYAAQHGSIFMPYEVGE